MSSLEELRFPDKDDLILVEMRIRQETHDRLIQISKVWNVDNKTQIIASCIKLTHDLINQSLHGRRIALIDDYDDIEAIVTVTDGFGE